MDRLKELREQRDIKAREAHAINAKYPDPKQRMEKADADKLDAVLSEVEAIDEEIARQIRMNQIANPETPEAEHQAALNAATVDPSRQRNPQEAAALRAFLASGIAALSREQLLAMQSRTTPEIRAAMSTTTAGEGGYTTAPQYMIQLLETMAAYGGMRGVANNIRTASGTQMLWPTADATAEEGEIVGQNAPVGAGDTTFGQTSLDVYKYSSKKIALPFELLQDTFLDIEMYIQTLLATRIARIQAKHHTTGTGVGQPTGIVTVAAAGKVGAAGQVTTVTYDDLVDLEHSVDPVYRGLPGVGYMMHDSSLKVVRKIKDAQNRPIFVPGYEANAMVNGGAPDMLMGRPIRINQAMPVMAANAKSILFGLLRSYMIRDVMDLTLFRMTDSAFTLNGQVGFVAFQRSGGNQITGGQPVTYYQNPAA